MNELANNFKAKVVAFNEDGESGMEAAQVILILFLVVIGLIPILIRIKDAIAQKGTSVGNTIVRTT